MVESPTARRSPPRPRDADTRRVLILGLGNPMMADDGVGHEVISRLKMCDLPTSVRPFAVDGDVLTLTSLWRGEPAVWLIDAVSSNRRPGRICVYGHHELFQLPTGGFSTHHQNVGECLRWILHAQPEMASIEFRLYGIEAGAVRPVRGLTDEVENAIGQLVDELRARINQ